MQNFELFEDLIISEELGMKKTNINKNTKIKTTGFLSYESFSLSFT